MKNIFRKLYDHNWALKPSRMKNLDPVTGKSDQIWNDLLTKKSKLPFVHENDQTLVKFINPSMVHGPWIAGGACLDWFNGSNATGDIDIFCKDEDQAKEVNKKLQGLSFCSKKHTGIPGTSNYTISVYDKDKNKTIIKEVQIIEFKFFETAKSVIQNFDYSIVQIVTDGIQTLFGLNTKSDIKQKIIRPSNTESIKPVSSIRRLTKYIAYGYIPTASLLDEIKNNPETKWDYLQDLGDYSNTL